MFINDFWKVLARAPEGETGGADPGAGAGAGADAGAGGGAGAGDPPAGAGAGAGAGDPPGDGAPAPKWWEDKGINDDQRQYLKAKGLTVDDPMQAIPKIIEAHRNAEKRLGKPAEMLMERPGEGKDVADWMRENAALFGIPEAPDKYDVKPPESWPKDAAWDTDFEQQARALAYEAGISGPALQKLTDLYAGKLMALDKDAGAQLEAASAKMSEELQRDWGDQYSAKVAMAQQAASLLAEKAGLDSDAMTNLAQVLGPKIGDAGVIRLFATVGEMAGEDMAVALKGGGTMGTTPAEARQTIEAMKAPESEYSKEAEKVRKGGSRRRYDELRSEFNRLQKLAAR